MRIAPRRRPNLARNGPPGSKKNELKPHRSQYWCIPPGQNAQFVAAMEDVLDVYQQPYDALRPVVCMDETSKQLVAETRTPVPAQPGQTRRVDYEYERKGTADVFMFTESTLADLRQNWATWLDGQVAKIEVGELAFHCGSGKWKFVDVGPAE